MKNHKQQQGGSSRVANFGEKLKNKAIIVDESVSKV